MTTIEIKYLFAGYEDTARKVFNFNTCRYEYCQFSKRLINSILYEVCKRDVDTAKDNDYTQLKNYEYKINVQPSYSGMGNGNDYRVIKKCLNIHSNKADADPLEMLKELEPIELKQAEEKKEKEMAKTPKVVVSEMTIDDLEKHFTQVQDDEQINEMEAAIDSKLLRYQKLEKKVDELLEKRQAVFNKMKLVENV